MRVRALWGGLVAVMLLLAAPPARAGEQPRRSTTARDQQQSVTDADIQRLQDTVYDLSGDVARVRSRDVQAADQMQGDLDNLRDEVIYLKVKLRKEGIVQRTEYWDLRDRLDDLRARVRDALSGGQADANRPMVPPPPKQQSGRVTGTGQPLPPPPPPADQPEVRQPTSSNPNEVPSGTEVDVRLTNPLSSETAQVEDRFEATTIVDLTNSGGRVLIPAGAVVRGVVTSVNKAGHLDRKGSLTLSFDQITMRGRSYPIHGTVTQALEGEGIRGDVGKIGAGAGIGAVIGGIIGGVKGALAGILIGGGGTVAATTGKDVELQPGTVLRVRFDSPLVVR